MRTRGVEAVARRKSRGERTGMIYPIALEAVQRLDALFEIERGSNGTATEERLAVRQDLSAPLMAPGSPPSSRSSRAATIWPRR
ncbi:hypothetical protein LK12_19300 [Novosphingobium malaysiense]|uniref:Uncharacterized protein n=1 Tax=Novosphingobium malaysiense TaxID=1348853 RepID=A0A0B1ZLG7_9SPHN|nr:hypothetical protein LK12_19300 [Novosphingobium malaysiense]